MFRLDLDALTVRLKPAFLSLFPLRASIVYWFACLGTCEVAAFFPDLQALGGPAIIDAARDGVQVRSA